MNNKPTLEHPTPALDWLKERVGKKASDSPSPLMRWLNPTLLSVEKGKMEFSIEIRPEMMNPLRITHGGIIAAIIDDVIGATTMSLDNGFYSTINLQVDYFSPSKLGDTLIASSGVTKKGQQIVNVICEIWNESKTRLLAKGSSNLIHVKQS